MALHFAIVRTNDADPDAPAEILIAQNLPDALEASSNELARFGSRKRKAKHVRAAYERAVHNLHQATIRLP